MAAERSVQLASTEPSPSRGQKRAAKILEVAADLFLGLGYERTSMHTIIQKSGGSKATLYNYFPTKADLFRAVVESVVAGVGEPELDPDADIKETLTRFAEQRMSVVRSPRHIGLVRLVISEQGRFPDIARTYWEEGPRKRTQTLRRYLEALSRDGRLNLDDPKEAAEFFNAGLLNPWYIRELYLPSGAPSDEELRQQAARTIDRFLTLFQP